MESVGWRPHPGDAVILGYCSSPRAQQADVVTARLGREIGPAAGSEVGCLGEHLLRWFPLVTADPCVFLDYPLCACFC